jgi:DNA-binding NarL/FixJ family response regulator
LVGTAVYQGQVWANSEQIHFLLNTLRRTSSVWEPSSTALKLLATRETHVANLVTEGLPNREVALRLGITEHTVSNYLFRIYNKLGISSRVELVLYIMKGRGHPPLLAAGQSDPEQGEKARWSHKGSASAGFGEVRCDE